MSKTNVSDLVDAIRDAEDGYVPSTFCTGSHPPLCVRLLLTRVDHAGLGECIHEAEPDRACMVCNAKQAVVWLRQHFNL